MAAHNAKQIAGRHLHGIGLVGHRLGGDAGREGESRESGNGLDEHFDSGLKFCRSGCVASVGALGQIRGTKAGKKGAIQQATEVVGRNEWIEYETLCVKERQVLRMKRRRKKKRKKKKKKTGLPDEQKARDKKEM